MSPRKHREISRTRIRETPQLDRKGVNVDGNAVLKTNEVKIADLPFLSASPVAFPENPKAVPSGCSRSRGA